MDREQIAKLEQEYAALKAERDAIKLKLAEVPAMEKRLAQLNNGWNRRGEVEQAEFKLRDAKLPILQESRWGDNLRIVNIEPKWIVCRTDGQSEVQRFRRSDGMQEHSRKYGRKINPEEALKIWTRHYASLNGEQNKP